MNRCHHGKENQRMERERHEFLFESRREEEEEH